MRKGLEARPYFCCASAMVLRPAMHLVSSRFDMVLIFVLNTRITPAFYRLGELPGELLQHIILCGLQPGLLVAPTEGEFNPQYGSSFAAAMAGIGSTSKQFRRIAKEAFVTKGSTVPLADFAAGLAFPDDRTPQQALYDFRAPVAAQESSIRGGTCRPACSAEIRNKLLKAAIRDSRHGVAAMLLSLPGMDPDQLVDDDGNTLLTAAISRKDHSLTLLLLKQPRINIRKANTAGQTPIALVMQQAMQQGLYSDETDDDDLLGQALVELLNEYYSRGHSYGDLVNQDLAQHACSGKDDNVAWVLSFMGIIQNCHFFQGAPHESLQIMQLNRPFVDYLDLKPAIHAAAEAEHINTVVFLLSLHKVGLDLHALVSYCRILCSLNATSLYLC